MYDLLAGLLEGYVASRTPSQRWQILARVFFGALGCVLSAVGAFLFAFRRADPTLPLRMTVMVLFASMGAVFLFNVMLARKWRWPGVLFVASFVAMFVTRLVWGA